MMKSVKAILAPLFVVIVMCMGSIVYAQPNIPKEKIPSDISEDVTQQMKRLYSSDPADYGR